jgi:hypothetical protein
MIGLRGSNNIQMRAQKRKEKSDEVMCVRLCATSNLLNIYNSKNFIILINFLKTYILSSVF